MASSSSSTSWFEPPELRLRSGTPPTTLDQHTIAFALTPDGSGVHELASTAGAHPQFAYTPNRALRDDAAREHLVLSRTLFLSVLHQWHSVARRFPCARAALLAAAQQYCPFPPVQAALQSVHAAPTFADVLAMPPTSLWLVEDFLQSVARAVLPALITDDLVGLKLNLVAAKLLHDGSLAQPTPAAQVIPETRTFEELALLEKALFAQNIAWEFNITPQEQLSELVTEHTLVVVKTADGTYACVAVVALGGEASIYVPSTPNGVALLPAEDASKVLMEQALDGQALKEMDLSCLLDADQRDDRTTQLDVVVVDCSGSMAGLAFPETDKDMRRSDAAQILFNMLVDKYRSLEINAEVACVLFGSTIDIACPFTKDLAVFETLLGRAGNMGCTMLWDALHRAVELLVARRTELLASGTLHPQCRLRVIAVTDGEDTGSRVHYADVARRGRKEDVVIDAFMLGREDDQKLRSLAHAAAGVTLQFRDIQDATELFELPFVVKASARAVREDLPPAEGNLEAFTDLDKYPRVTATSARTLVMVETSAPSASSASGGGVPSSGSGVPSARTKGATRRLVDEVKRLINGEGASFGVVAVSITDPFNVALLVKGPEDSLYKDAFLLLELHAPADFPFRAVAAHFAEAHKLFHPQVVGAKVCSEMKTSWSPRMTLLDAARALQASLKEPDLTCSVNSWASSLYQTDRAAYDAEVAKTLPGLSEAGVRGMRAAWIEATDASRTHVWTAEDVATAAGSTL